MRPGLIVLSGLIAAAVPAAGNDGFYENQCHAPAAWEKIDALLQQVPNDPLVIRAYALRLGICRLIEEGKIGLETGMEMFDLERRRLIMERSMEESRKQRRPSDIEDEDFDPVS